MAARSDSADHTPPGPQSSSILDLKGLSRDELQFKPLNQFCHQNSCLYL
uniref:Uncharacterized protein n=1 Tax=Anguilla anguilla TaxID=7936 RepID=A0A0E9XXS5_ANGAN